MKEEASARAGGTAQEGLGQLRNLPELGRWGKEEALLQVHRHAQVSEGLGWLPHPLLRVALQSERPQ